MFTMFLDKKSYFIAKEINWGVQSTVYEPFPNLAIQRIKGLNKVLAYPKNFAFLFLFRVSESNCKLNLLS